MAFAGVQQSYEPRNARFQQASNLMPRLSRTVIALPLVFAALFVVGRPARAGVGVPIREDAEVGLRLCLTPDWRPIPSVRYEWQFKRGAISLGVSFDYGGPESNLEGL